MALHLFSTPVECTHCGSVVTDPTIDYCPQCHELLRERRTPARLAGVERRYRNLRFLLGFLRFLAVIILLIGALLFLGAEDEASSWTVRLLILLGSVVLSSGVVATVGLFDIALDMEENTRASFRLQQQILHELQQRDDARSESAQGI